MVGECCSLI